MSRKIVRAIPYIWNFAIKSKLFPNTDMFIIRTIGFQPIPLYSLYTQQSTTKIQEQKGIYMTSVRFRVTSHKSIMADTGENF